MVRAFTWARTRCRHVNHRQVPQHSPRTTLFTRFQRGVTKDNRNVFFAVHGNTLRADEASSHREQQWHPHRPEAPNTSKKAFKAALLSRCPIHEHFFESRAVNRKLPAVEMRLIDEQSSVSGASLQRAKPLSMHERRRCVAASNTGSRNASLPTQPAAN